MAGLDSTGNLARAPQVNQMLNTMSTNLSSFNAVLNGLLTEVKSFNVNNNPNTQAVINSFGSFVGISNQETSAGALVPGATPAPTPTPPITCNNTIGGEYLQFDVGSSKTIGSYVAYSDNYNSYPLQSWSLVGSNDTFCWTVLDQHTNSLWDNGSYTTWTISSPTPFRYYRLIFIKFVTNLIPTLFKILDQTSTVIPVSSYSLSSTFPTSGSYPNFFINTAYSQRNYFTSCPTYSAGVYVGSVTTPTH